MGNRMEKFKSNWFIKHLQSRFIPKCFKEKQRTQIKARDKTIKIRKELAELAVFTCVCVGLTFSKCVFFLIVLSELPPCSLGRTGKCCRPCGRCWRSFERSCKRRRRGDASCSSPTPMTKPPGRSSGQRWSVRSPRYRWRLSAHLKGTRHNLVWKTSGAFNKQQGDSKHVAFSTDEIPLRANW